MDDSTLQAYLDGELPPEQATAVSRAAQTLPAVARRLEELTALQREVSGDLLCLDSPPDLDASQARLEASWLDRSTSQWSVLRRVAAVTILMAGMGGLVLAAEPVRDWLAARIGSVDEAAVGPDTGTRTTETRGAPSVEPTLDPEMTDLSVEALEGRLDVRLEGLAPGSPVLVEMIDAGLPLVRASSAAVFRAGNGLLEMTGGEGPVLVQIPRGLRSVRLHVDGRLYLELRQDSLFLQVEGLELDGDSIRFVVGGR